MEKTAILVISFGTTIINAEKSAYLVLENEIRAQFGENIVYRAYTSGMVRERLFKKGVDVKSPQEALEELYKSSVENIYILPTHIIPGEEYEKVIHSVMLVKEKFKNIIIAKPLLYSPEDYFNVANILSNKYISSTDEALVLMGHGSEHHANSAYPALNYVFSDRGYNNVFVGTVEGYPDLSDIIRKLKKTAYKNIVLAPLMLVAGDHVLNDMASDEEDSWKSILSDSGYNVSVQSIGLGEIPQIREIYISHLRDIMEVK